MATNDQRIAAALHAASLGLRIVILNNADGSPNFRKIPVGKNWGDKATDDEEILLRRFEKRPNANIGVLLGKYPAGSKVPGVIDVEFDSDEGRAAADRIFGSNTFTPTYKSARSVHRLFLWNDDFPPQQKLAIEGLEVRLGGGAKQTHSVMPPSTHSDGRDYQWLPGLSIGEVELAEVPEILAVQFTNVEAELEAAGLTGAASSGSGKSEEHWESIRHGVAEGSRNASLCSLVGRWAANCVHLDADAAADIRERAVAWGQKCTPPLPPKECESVARNVIARDRKRRAEEAEADAEQYANAVAPPPRGIRNDAGKPIPENNIGSDIEPAASHSVSLPVGESRNNNDSGANGEQSASRPEDSVPSRIAGNASGSGVVSSGPKPVAGIERAEIVTCNPPVLRLYSQFFAKAPGGCVSMPIADSLRVGSMTTHVVEQALTMPPSRWLVRGAWAKIVSRVIESAPHVDPDPELHRSSIIARTIQHYANSSSGTMDCASIKENGITAPSGVEMLKDGRIAINLATLHRYMVDERTLEKITREELIEVLKSAKADRKNWRGRLWILDAESQEKLARIESGKSHVAQAANKQKSHADNSIFRGGVSS